MNDTERKETIIRLTIIRAAVNSILTIVRECAFPMSGRFDGSPLRRAAAQVKKPPGHRPRRSARIQVPSLDSKEITQAAGLVQDREEAFCLLLRLFTILNAHSNVEETDDEVAARISVFMDALKCGRRLKTPALRLCQALRQQYVLDEKVFLNTHTKILLDHEEYYDAANCFPGAAAYAHMAHDSERSFTSAELIYEVRACKGSILSLKDKLDSLHDDQRKRLKGNKRGSRTFIGD